MSGDYQLLTRRQAIKRFRPGAPAPDSLPKSVLERDLRRDGIAQVKLAIAKTAFQDLSDQYAVCIEHHGIFLDWTAGNFDKKGIPENGHVSKSLGFNNAGMQINDPKNLFHFNNRLWARWNTALQSEMPQEFREFMDNGFELKHELTKAAMGLVLTLTESYEGLDQLYFPRNISATTLRLLRYDGYPTHDETGRLIVEQNAQVAKAHYDRGGMTIQAYSSAPGFWCKVPSQRHSDYEPVYPPYGEGQSQMFFGAGFRAIYGSRFNPIQPLYHGVKRIFDESLDYIPTRTAAILFVDAPQVDVRIKSFETQPERIDKENLDV